MNVLLLGAGGMLGRAVQSSAPVGITVAAMPRAALDVTDNAAVSAALQSRPEWVINCAACTRVDDAEAHEREATLVNGGAVGLLGRSARQVGARVLHVSTEYVFDGTLDRPYREDDRPDPQGAYGRGKLAGELALAASGCAWVTVRSQWLYGGGPSFVRTMWLRARQGLSSRVVDDQWGAPTHVAKLAAVLWRLIGADAEGTWHAAASGVTTWYDVARAVYEGADADPALVSRCSTAEYGARAPRPANGRLDGAKLTAAFGEMRPWDDVLRASLGSARDSAYGP